jgi:glycosyltransferase involved in cell wall biosynthesis
MVAPDNATLITPAGDEAALAAMLARLGADQALRDALGQANRVRALTEFDEGTMVARYAALYGEALGQPDFAMTAA